MTKIGATPHVPDEGAQLIRQTDVATQRDSWLRQMELAQLSDMNRAGTPYEREVLAHKPAAQHKQEQSRESGRLTTGGHETNSRPGDIPGKGKLRPLLPKAEQAVAASAPANNNASTSPVADSGKPMQEFSTTNGQHASHAAGDISVGIVASFKPFARPALPAAQGGAMVDAAAMALATRSSPIQAHMASEPVQVALPRPQAMPVSGAAAVTNGMPEAGAEHAETAQAEPASADAQLQEKPEWQDRMMHMTGDDQNVNVWIRDQALDGSQTSALIYRLASDMASVGMRLNGATINGRSVYRSTTTSSAQEDTAPTGTPPARFKRQVPGSNFTHLTNAMNKEQDHGA